MRSRTVFAGVLVALAGASSALGQNIGPSTTTAPYVLPTVPGVSTTSVLTVGDSIGGYRMVGIPDGLGAWQNPGQTGSFNLAMNHELGATSGIARAHGQTGSFVSQWVINLDLSVSSGRDHNTSSADAYEWTGSGWSNAASSAQRWARFCSADLAAPSAYRFGALGTDARIHMNGEENGAEGRAYAHIVSGAAADQTWALPALGKFSWENSVASPFAQQKTLVMGMDDTSPTGQVYLYVGNKTSTGNDIERAGLTNGNLFGVKVDGVASESRTAPPAANTRFSLFNHGDVTNRSGASLDTESTANDTGFFRPEDGAWDPRPGYENTFYFVTTDRFDQPGQVGRSRLWQMSFDDITDPTAGGRINCLLNGTEGQQMFDNICIDSHGRILLEEDVGNNARLGKIWLYDTTTQGLGVIAEHDASRFLTGAPGFLTQDEEASGIIDAKDILGDGYFLLDVQAHYGISGELVEGGQLLTLYVDPSIVPSPGTLALVGAAGLVGIRRRRA